MNYDVAYIKQLEAENEKLRSDMEKRDATLYELVRKKLEVKKDEGGRFYLRIKNNKEMYQLTDEEVLMLAGIDTEIVTPMEFPAISVNDIVSVQPMMSNTTYKDFVTTFGVPTGMFTNPTPSPNMNPFSKIAMPIIKRVLPGIEVDKEIKKIQEHQEQQKQMDKIRKQVEEENK